MRQSPRACVLLTLVAICAGRERAQAANLNVNCDKKETIHKALRLLAATNPQGPNTIFVSGGCKENVGIQSFDRLTLTTKTGASITDRSKGTLAVIDIVDSRGITLSNLTINGGALGVDCVGASVCVLNGNTIQGSKGDGIYLFRSQASLSGNTIQNNAGRGLAVTNGSTAYSENEVLSDNTSLGIAVGESFVFATTDTVKNNGTDGSDGIDVTDHGTLRLVSCTVTGNGGAGVGISRSSEARFDAYSGPNVITGNGADGVDVRDLSFAFFSAGNNVTGNSVGTDVNCSPQFSATRGALTNIGGGVTNCVEP